ncbi:TetR/AcrR family transcriptional regulator [Comamonas thiooxydans]|uniref:TetR/AcrR family transcriptional regulator n=1 Tax=Comamonas thiooxydans TaxID=363952 RepID=UPI00264D3F2F|nr:TetR/AcrR family transcriptional regulator [Burkholderia multivorans]
MPPLPQPRRVPRQSRSRALVDAILEATARVLTERGYAGTNTNLVAERAGVSVGSVYQYFPNKDSLITALHERHAVEMHAAMETVLASTHPLDLREKLGAIVHAWLAAHQVAPELHRVLEKEFPFFDAPSDQSAADHSIQRRIRQLLEDHQSEVVPQERELATWVVLRTMESLIHAAVIPPGAPCPAQQVEQAIVEMLAGYLCGQQRRMV